MRPSPPSYWLLFVKCPPLANQTTRRGTLPPPRSDQQPLAFLIWASFHFSKEKDSIVAGPLLSFLHITSGDLFFSFFSLASPLRPQGSPPSALLGFSLYPFVPSITLKSLPHPSLNSPFLVRRRLKCSRKRAVFSRLSATPLIYVIPLLCKLNFFGGPSFPPPVGRSFYPLRLSPPRGSGRSAFFLPRIANLGNDPCLFFSSPGIPAERSFCWCGLVMRW